MKRKSIAPNTTGILSSVAVPTTMDSPMPVFLRVAATFSA